MGDLTLRYRSHVMIGDLALDDCTIHRCGLSTGAKWWNLWFRIIREDGLRGSNEDGSIDICVPLNPNHDFVPNGPGGRHWGFTKTGAGIWTVFPSVNVLADNGTHVHPGEYPNGKSIWHHTPDVAGVPDDEPWSR